MSTSTSVLGLIHEEHMLFLSLFFSPNNCLENVSLSDQSMASNPRKGQAKRPGAKTTSHDGRAGHVMTALMLAAAKGVGGRSNRLGGQWVLGGKRPNEP